MPQTIKCKIVALLAYHLTKKAPWAIIKKDPKIVERLFCKPIQKKIC